MANFRKKVSKLPQYRITPLVVVAVGLVLLGTFIMSNFAATEPIHPDGTLVRDNMGTLNNTADDKIYLISASQKRLIPDDKIIASQGYSKSQIKDATKGDLAMQTGPNVSYREGTIMFGSDFSPYVVDNFDLNILGSVQNKNQARKIFDDLTTLSSMGYNYDILRALFAGAVTSNFPEKGLIIKNDRIHYDGIFVRNGKDYYVITNQAPLGKATKRPVPNSQSQDVPTILKSYDYELRNPNLVNLQKIKQATPDDMALANATKPLDYREGTILKGSGNSKFIVDSDNLTGADKVREFVDDATYNSLGYSAAEIITISDTELNSYPRGPKVEFSSIIIAAPKPPVASISASPTKATAPAEIAFDGSSSSDPDGNVAKFQWDFADGATGEGAKVSHTFAKAGVYNVKLTVTDNSGLVASQNSAVTIEAAVAPPTVTPGSPGTGYVIWDSATWQPDHLAGMQRQKPSMIRWAVSWDRQVADETKHGFALTSQGFQWVWPQMEPAWHGTNRNTEPDKFFKQLKASCYSNYGGSGFDINSESSWGTYDAKRCTTLVVSQHGIKEVTFDWPANIGACPDAGYKNGVQTACHWPNFSNGKLSGYMQELYDILRGYLPKDKIVWEDFNEADLRWGSTKHAVYGRSDAGAAVNYNTEWKPNEKGGYGTAPYTGGTGADWVKMHQLVKDKAGSSTPITYASGALLDRYWYEPENASMCPEIAGTGKVFCSNEDWLKATAPLVGISSFHVYGDAMTTGAISNGTSNDFESSMTSELDKWKKQKGVDMPFYFGEIGPSSTAVTSLTKAEALAMMDRHNFMLDSARSPRTAGKYMGMTFLGFVGKYKINPWQTRYGWWDPRFDPDDVVTTP